MKRFSLSNFGRSFGWMMQVRPVTTNLFFSFLLNLLIEIMSRHSLVKAVVHMVTMPHLFLFNVLILAATMSLALFFTKRVFVTVLIALIWFLLGMINGILLFFRTTPFSFSDILVLKSVSSIITVYLKLWQLILIIAFFVLIILGLVLLYRRSPKWKRRPIRGGISLVTIAGLVAYLAFLYVSKGVLATNIPNIADAYQQYGFVTMYSESVFVRGVNKPGTYSARNVRDIAKMLGIEEQKRKKKTVEEEQPVSQMATQDTPNIIYLQLESFFDPTHLKGMTYSVSPVPFYQELKENYTSGYLNVPSFGAGTANTEFEILTGMNLDFFGPGEYPFSTILREETCESMAYNLRELGYTSHMIHNNKGSFYGRNRVYPNLGFDTFTSIEYMQGIQINPLGWAKDKVLTDQILQVLDSSENQDLVYTISVQGHGKYPEEEVEGYKLVKVNDCQIEDWTETEITAFEYYLNQIRQMDDFLRELTAALEKRPEPSILILYGDHLPDFPFKASDMDNNSLYQTEYVIWQTGVPMIRETGEMEAYQLSSYVMDRLHKDNGVLTKLHQMREDNAETYLDDLKTLEYDMLYGNRIIYSGKNPYPPSEMQFGTKEVVLTEAIYNQENRTLTVKGDNFTEWSSVFINGKEQPHTIFIGPQSLLVEDVDIEEEDAVMVAQVTGDREMLSQTEEYYMLDME